jgi:hypothetical protein
MTGPCGRASQRLPYLAYRQPRYLASNRQTGGFASPPYDGFALSVRGQLIGKKSSGQTVCISANVAKWRLPYAVSALKSGRHSDDRYVVLIEVAREFGGHWADLPCAVPINRMCIEVMDGGTRSRVIRTSTTTQRCCLTRGKDASPAPDSVAWAASAGTFLPPHRRGYTCCIGRDYLDRHDTGSQLRWI